MPQGTRVHIDIAQGLAVGTGVVAAAEYDDGWFFRIEDADGADFDLHRNDAGELWVCQSEIQPQTREPGSDNESD